MKKIEAYIHSHRFSDVREKLNEIGIEGMTAIEVRGFGKQQGASTLFRGSETSVEFIRNTKIEIVVNDDIAEKVIETITNTVQTGHIGDGNIFISTIDDAVRIRTGERGKGVV